LLILGIGMGGTLCASDIVGEVNGVKITKDALEDFSRQFRPGQTAKYELFSPEERRQLLDRFIEHELMAEAARKSGVEKDPEYQKKLEQARRELMIGLWLRKQYKTLIVSDGEAREYYEKHPDEFLVPEQVHARHILLNDEKKAREIIGKLQGLTGEKLKEKFIELAKSDSTGPSSRTGGDLGFFKREQMVVPFAKAVFSMKDGEVSSRPVKTEFGWHVIYREESRPARKIPFESVKKKILEEIRQKHFSEKMTKEIEAMKKNATIRIDLPSSAKESLKP